VLWLGSVALDSLIPCKGRKKKTGSEQGNWCFGVHTASTQSRPKGKDGAAREKGMVGRSGKNQREKTAWLERGQETDSGILGREKGRAIGRKGATKPTNLRADLLRAEAIDFGKQKMSSSSRTRAKFTVHFSLTALARVADPTKPIYKKERKLIQGVKEGGGTERKGR